MHTVLPADHVSHLKDLQFVNARFIGAHIKVNSESTEFVIPFVLLLIFKFRIAINDTLKKCVS